VEIHVRPHPIFERDRYDIWCELPLTFTQLTLGAEIEIPTLNGKEKYTVREGTQPGDVITLKGKGIPFLQRRGQGDLHARVTVEVPKGLNAKQRELLQAFEDSLGERNYEKRKSFFSKVKDIFS
jgi:molecular chaperone DnaJ